MVRALLDTHVFLWWITDDPRLSGRATELISDGGNELFFSAASGWEISIKAGLGRLEIPGDLERFVTDQLSRNAILTLPVHLSHALHTGALPGHHRDPFDRILVSQALLEKMPLVSADPQIARYPIDVVW